MIKNTNNLRVYTINDVAEFLQMSPRTIYNFIRNGQLKGIKFGNKWRFTEEQIKDLIQLISKRTVIKGEVEDEGEPRRY
jgi:excisionase family DNA binding protein